ncbi:hypothetical protein D2V08_12805 [Flagellimonas lutimaris]|uniref:Uncharacterized protein n=2 Tax=Flagellimonas lutimaris TaxID=475082 RepID=A0A3A1N833_9FLAO|nr:hypothetical protein D2V08_12805 [Allomuricauda lutimaris]
MLSLTYSCENNNTDINKDAVSIEEDPYRGIRTPGLKAEILEYDKTSMENWKLGNSNDFNEFYFINMLNNPFEPIVIVYRQEGSSYNIKKYKFYPIDSEHTDILYSREYYIERTTKGWTKMKSLGPMFDRDDWGIMTLNISKKGTIVIDDAKNGDVIRISRIKNGIREEPRPLGEEINTGKWTAHPYIAPDESYLIWDSEREEGYGGADLYISFRQKDGSWGKAINLGEKINTKLWENGARVTPDGKFLTFSRSEEIVRKDGTSYWAGNGQWVSTQVIENLRPKE